MQTGAVSGSLSAKWRRTGTLPLLTYKHVYGELSRHDSGIDAQSDPICVSRRKKPELTAAARGSTGYLKGFFVIISIMTKNFEANIYTAIPLTVNTDTHRRPTL